MKRSKDLSLLRKTAAAAAATVVEDTSRLDQTDHRLTTFSFFCLENSSDNQFHFTKVKNVKVGNANRSVK